MKGTAHGSRRVVHLEGSGQGAFSSQHPNPPSKNSAERNSAISDRPPSGPPDTSDTLSGPPDAPSAPRASDHLDGDRELSPIPAEHQLHLLADRVIVDEEQH